MYFKSIDRLGRNYNEIIEQWRIITKDKGVDIVVLDMPLLDTRKGKDLLGTFISDLVLQLLSFVSENERAMIKQRQAEGIAAAKTRGVKFGRSSLKKSEFLNEIIEEYYNKNITCREAGAILGVCHNTFLKWLNELKNGD